MPEIQGHRGARALRPENTLPGLAHALSVGVDAIEFDVTLTADGGLILAHDLTVDATTITGSGDYVGRRWADLTLAQVATLDAGYRRPPEPFEATFVPVPGTGVPTLGQVCRLIAEAGAAEVTLAVELKTDASWPAADVARLADGALATLAAHGLTRQARILAFDWRVLRAARAGDQSVPRVALIEPRTWAQGSPWLAGQDTAAGMAVAARGIGAAWLSPWDPLTSADLVAETHREGLRIVPWTVNEPDRMGALIEYGVDAIVTDRPDVLRGVFAERGHTLPRRYDIRS